MTRENKQGLLVVILMVGLAMVIAINISTNISKDYTDEEIEQVRTEAREYTDEMILPLFDSIYAGIEELKRQYDEQNTETTPCVSR